MCVYQKRDKNVDFSYLLLLFGAVVRVNAIQNVASALTLQTSVYKVAKLYSS